MKALIYQQQEAYTYVVFANILYKAAGAFRGAEALAAVTKREFASLMGALDNRPNPKTTGLGT